MKKNKQGPSKKVSKKRLKKKAQQILKTLQKQEKQSLKNNKKLEDDSGKEEVNDW